MEKLSLLRSIRQNVHFVSQKSGFFVIFVFFYSFFNFILLRCTTALCAKIRDKKIFFFSFTGAGVNFICFKLGGLYTIPLGHQKKKIAKNKKKFEKIL